MYTSIKSFSIATRILIEIIVILITMISPWIMGSVEPGAEFCLLSSVGLLLILWSIRLLAEGGFTWAACSLTVAIASMLLFSLFQLIPLPRSILHLVSPANVSLHDQLYPANSEILLGETKGIVNDYSFQSSISLSPAATRVGCIRLLAIFLLFIIVRHNVLSSASLKRLSIAAVVNGALLSLFAFIQFFSSPVQTIYWTFPVLGIPFGPFICKNHFPFYVNVCMGLGIGILLVRCQSYKLYRSTHSWLPDFSPLLHDPAILWLFFSTSLMIFSTFFSLSRGGVLAISLSCIIFLLCSYSANHSVSRISFISLFIIFLTGSVIIFWFDFVHDRIASLWNGQVVADLRLPLWYDGLMIGARFPLFGAGLGSFYHTELMFRHRSEFSTLAAEYAHNEYVEAWAEGGVVRLILTIVIIGLFYRSAAQALRNHAGRSDRGLIIGALFSFTTVVVHSFFDFGLHIPSIAFLVTVVAAYLVALSDPDAGSSRFPNYHSSVYSTIRWFGFAPFFAFIASVILAIFLSLEGWRWAQGYAHQVIAREAAMAGRYDEWLQARETAARILYDQADVHFLAGRAYIDVYENNVEPFRRRIALQVGISGVFSGSPLIPFAPGHVGMVYFRPADIPSLSGEQGELARRYLLPGLKHMLQTRNLCPLMARPHFRIASNREWFVRADTREAYIDRGKLTFPISPETWYLAGQLELLDGRPDAAWSSWRESLRRSPEFLGPILERAKRSLDSQSLIDRLLPDTPDILLMAVNHVYDEDDERRIPILRRALGLLDSHSRELSAGDYYLKSRIQLSLGEELQAIESLEEALLRGTPTVSWRYELAVLLRKNRRLKDARRELLSVLAREPAHSAAKDLLLRIAREIAEGD